MDLDIFCSNILDFTKFAVNTTLNDISIDNRIYWLI